MSEQPQDAVDAMRALRDLMRQRIIEGGGSAADADVAWKRFGARLGGHTHAEAVAMFPDVEARAALGEGE